MVFNRVIDQSLVERYAENFFLQLQLADSLVLQIFDFYSRHLRLAKIFSQQSISILFPDQNISAVRSGHRSSNQDDVLFRIDLDDAQILDRIAFDAHMAGHARSLDHARGIGRCTDRAGRAVKHRAVRRASAAETVPLDEAGEAAALAGAYYIDNIVLRKLIYQNLVADVDT